MPYTDSARNLKADGVAAQVDFLGLSDESNTELTGGSYARKAITWAAAASGVAASNLSAVFDVPAGNTAAFVLLRTLSSGGTDYGFFPVGGQAPLAATFAASSDTFTSYAHGYSNGHRVTLMDVQGAGLSTGFAEGIMYYVVSASTDTFQLSATLAGAAITSSADMECAAQRGIPEVFGSAGTLTIASGNISIDERFI